jgi:uncharacterized membrane protein
MLPEPIHPVIVHFPVVFVVLLPMFALVSLWAIRRGSRPSRAWLASVAMAAALAGSAWLALETGEAQEDRVEAVVSERALHDHEEAAERFLALSAVLLLVTGAGLIPGRVGGVSRIAATVGALGLVVAGVQVGASGGDLVYEHGAANAYVATGSGGASDPIRAAASRPAESGEADEAERDDG